MTTLDLRGSSGTLRLNPNVGSSSVRGFLGIGPAGPPGPPGPAVTVSAGSVSVADNGDGTATLTAATGGALTDNNDGTATIAG